ncbi:MAG: STAS domain-containing protein [Smithellaceae bacterium]
MTIVVNQDSDISVFALSGRLDAVSAPQLEDRIGLWFEQPGIKLIFNLEALDYISSAGLRVFLTCAKKMKTRDGKFCMAGLRPQVKEVFTISGFITLIPEYATVGAAKDALR